MSPAEHRTTLDSVGAQLLEACLWVNEYVSECISVSFALRWEALWWAGSQGRTWEGGSTVFTQKSSSLHSASSLDF